MSPTPSVAGVGVASRAAAVRVRVPNNSTSRLVKRDGAVLIITSPQVMTSPSLLYAQSSPACRQVERAFAGCKHTVVGRLRQDTFVLRFARRQSRQKDETYSNSTGEDDRSATAPPGRTTGANPPATRLSHDPGRGRRPRRASGCARRRRFGWFRGFRAPRSWWCRSESRFDDARGGVPAFPIVRGIGSRAGRCAGRPLRRSVPVPPRTPPPGPGSDRPPRRPPPPVAPARCRP